ncbi:MAG: DUF975 family protein [Symbiobacteriaceae bacterium]|nr:DUF975 family protein [Symbiobacteriaceae bacterium]
MEINFTEVKREAQSKLQAQFRPAFLAFNLMPLLGLLVNCAAVWPFFRYGFEEVLYAFSLPQTNRLIQLSSLLLLPVYMACSVGASRIYLTVWQGETAHFRDILWGFNDIKRSMLGVLPLYLVQWVNGLLQLSSALFGQGVSSATVNLETPISALALLPSVIVGIITAFIQLNFWMLPYIIGEDPDISYRDAWRRALQLARGYRRRVFLFELSFFGWLALTALTLGLAVLYVGPYLSVAMAGFYARRVIISREEPSSNYEKIS